MVRLNQAVALAEAGQEARGLQIIDALAGDLGDYQPFHAARAHLLHRLHRTGESSAAYARAIALATSDADIRFLQQKRAKLLN